MYNINKNFKNIKKNYKSVKSIEVFLIDIYS